MPRNERDRSAGRLVCCELLAYTTRRREHAWQYRKLLAAACEGHDAATALRTDPDLHAHVFLCIGPETFGKNLLALLERVQRLADMLALSHRHLFDSRVESLSVSLARPGYTAAKERREMYAVHAPWRG